MDANENSFGSCIPTILQSEMKTINSDYHLERYPDPRQTEIKQRLMLLRCIPHPDHFFIGVGSDECIDLSMRIFCRPGQDKILITPATYGMYSVCAQTNDVAIVQVPLLSFQLDVPKVGFILV